MTTAQLVEELRRSLGNRTDIADARYVTWLNWALLDLCGYHRQRVFPSVWFHELEDSFLFDAGPVTGEVTGGTATAVELAAGEPATVGFYADCVLELGPERRLIRSYADQAAVVVPGFPAAPEVGDPYAIYRRGLRFGAEIPQGAVRDVWAILRIEYGETGQALEHVEWEELSHGDPRAVGQPLRFARHGGQILFDAAPAATTVFRAWVYRFPVQLDILEPERETVLPDQWDEVVVLGALWRGFESLMEPERATEAKDRYVNAATNRNSSYAVEAPHVRRGVRVKRDY